MRSSRGTETRHAVSERYWRKQAANFAAHYDRNRSTVFTRFVRRFVERRARIVDNWLTVAPGTKVLDAGCGHGVHLVNLARQGAVLTGVDLSADMIDLARKTLAGVGVDNAELICASFMEAPLPSASYGVALAIGLLDYLPDWRPALRRLAGSATVGGTVIFSIPKRPSPFFFLRTGPGIWFRRLLFDLPPVVVTASRAELTAAAAEAGLNLRDVIALQQTMWLVRADRVR